jgi:hypothetical protein
LYTCCWAATLLIPSPKVITTAAAANTHLKNFFILDALLSFYDVCNLTFFRPAQFPEPA